VNSFNSLSQATIQSPRPELNEVLLCHFGGPTHATEVEPFLQKLFEDPLIIRAPIPNWARKMLARKIARKRAPETTHHYQEIGFSPINRFTDSQADHLQNELLHLGKEAKVRVVNRYTEPFANTVLPRINWQEARIFLLTLYPHFCHSTTASAMKDVDNAAGQLGIPQANGSIRIFSWWHNEMYQDYCWDLIREQLEILARRNEPTRIVFSAHGIPTRYAERGDPYPHEIKAHFSSLRKRGTDWLIGQGLTPTKVTWHLSFQSRVGPVPWLKPYTQDTLEELGKRDGGHLLLVPISFVSDHIETLHEMDITYKNLALQSGFLSYSRSRMPNDDRRLAICLADVLIKAGL
jgi:protoporphyrin/coproporphyrin ferrochelatase